ncbi:MAG: outer membrane beta-barrel protein [Bacteroidales bacterium]|nr:outer membrane beta-barrel protein [Bacteroidales bacterium]
MKYRFFKAAFMMLLLVTGVLNAQAQNYNLKIKLVDKSNGEPVGYATVAITPDGKTEVFKYTQSDDQGAAEIKGIPAGKYKVAAILMGYDNYEEVITINKDTDLGTKQMNVQANFLKGATVSDVGNPITVKKDTITHNVTLIKSGDNDMLEDLLKKLPGIEISSDGSITANGKTINKIQIDGKQFFLDDPTIASKNLPANIIERVSVVDKKSEQAEFTGIDDGEEETVLDLGVRKGMMNGWFGNMMGGGGYDLQPQDNKARYQGAAMVANFTESNQLAFIGNANNTNNRGFNDLAASSMGSMRGGGFRGGMGGGGWGRNGESSSYMAGFNGSHTWADKSEITGNAMFNGNERHVEEKTARETFQKDGSSVFSDDDGYTNTSTWGVRAGARADWKISKNTSLLFEPNFNVGWGDFDEKSTFGTWRGADGVKATRVNEGTSASFGDSHNQSANGRILWRQRLGKAGRTISVNARYNINNSDMEGYNQSLTRTFTNIGNDPVTGAPVYWTDESVIDQMYQTKSKSQGANGRVSYTEPLGKNFFLEANYMYNYTYRVSTKETFDRGAGGQYVEKDEMYSSDITNKVQRQNIGLNLRKQEEKYNVTVGASLQPQKTVNHTANGTVDTTLTLKVMNWSPNARVDIHFNDATMLRVNYRGNSQQPSLTQMMPVPDNSNPQRVTLGNLGLNPSFSHNMNVMYNSTNMQTYASFNANLNFSYTTNNIVNASWIDSKGVNYIVPMNNDKGAWSTRAFIMFNTPIAKSRFSIMSFTNANYSNSVSLVGNDDIDSHNERSYLNLANYTQNTTSTVGLAENLRFTYRDDIVEASIGGGTRFSQSWYSVSEKNHPATFTSNVQGNFIAKIPNVLNISTDARYTRYDGYNAEFNDPTFVWNAEISKQLFKNQFTLAVKVYDILNQSKNTYRSNTSNYVQDTRNNTLGRYVMLSLTYRFGNFGGQRGGMRGPGGWGGGPGRRF